MMTACYSCVYYVRDRPDQVNPWPRSRIRPAWAQPVARLLEGKNGLTLHLALQEYSVKACRLLGWKTPSQASGLHVWKPSTPLPSESHTLPPSLLLLPGLSQSRLLWPQTGWLKRRYFSHVWRLEVRDHGDHTARFWWGQKAVLLLCSHGRKGRGKHSRFSS